TIVDPTVTNGPGATIKTVYSPTQIGAVPIFDGRVAITGPVETAINNSNPIFLSLNATRAPTTFYIGNGNDAVLQIAFEGINANGSGADTAQFFVSAVVIEYIWG
ncbi:MAG TPA: hypothetical protein VII94_05360, partial [Candidatus Saccharimonadales bacterium]